MPALFAARGSIADDSRFVANGRRLVANGAAERGHVGAAEPCESSKRHLASSEGLKPAEIRTALRLTRELQKNLLEAWSEFQKRKN